MVSLCSDEIYREISRRRLAGILTRRWYRCHGCGAEYPLADGVRTVRGCGNTACLNPNIHIHSDLDGEQPKTL